MKKLCCVFLTFAALTLCANNAMADDDPVWCFVEINYHGSDFGGHDDGITEEAAIHEAKEEACDRACRKDGDACEQDCMMRAVVKGHECKENPKANKNNPKGDYDCRIAIRYNGSDYHGINNDHHLDKTAREAVEKACENACQSQDKPKKCEHKCRVNAEVIGTECFDKNDRLVLNQGQLPPRPADFHPNAATPAPAIAAPPAPIQDKINGKDDKKAPKDDKIAGKDDKKAGKDDKKAVKDDKKTVKDDKKAGKDDKKAGKDDKKAGKDDKKGKK